MELKARARDKVSDCAGHEDLTGTSEIYDPCSGMHGYTTNIIVPDLDLPRMEAAAHLNTKWPEFLDNCGSAAHSAGWAIKGGEKAVAERFDLSPAEAGQFLAHRLVMSCQQNAPIPVAELGRTSARSNDIREQHGREHPIWVGLTMFAGQKHFERVDDLIGDLAFTNEAMVAAWELQILGTRDLTRQSAAFLNRYIRIVNSVHYQRRCPDGRKDMLHIDRGVHLHQLDCSSGTGALTFPTSEVAEISLVLCLLWGKIPCDLAGPPSTVKESDPLPESVTREA
jgi:hypothetical protein